MASTISHQYDADPWSSVEAAQAEVARLLVGRDPMSANDPVNAILLSAVAALWAKEGTDAFIAAARDLRVVRKAIHEIGPSIKGLRRRCARLAKSSERFSQTFGSSPHNPLVGYVTALEQFVVAFDELERQTAEVAGRFVPVDDKIREHPAKLVQLMAVVSRRIPAVSALLTKRGLAIYAIATKRDPPCGDADEFSGREARWKRNRQLARRDGGTQPDVN